MNRDWILWLAVGALLIAGAGTAVYLGARGLRNNNPGNIRHGSSRWQGMNPVQTDKDFVQFTNPIYGIRAIAKLLNNYQNRYGLNTIEEIISRWAPPSENITGAYVANVANKAGVSSRKQILIDDYMFPIVKTIIEHENGSNPYSDAQIMEGIRLA